jgi:hypothetical protein
MPPRKHPIPIIPCLQFLAILMLVLAFFTMPSNYYSFLRCIVVIACIATIYDSVNWTVTARLKWFLRAVFVLLGLLFNPVVLCTFNKTTWGFIDFGAITALFWAFSATRENPDQHDTHG